MFTQTAVGRKPAPWGRIAPGERVWMKWTGGPVVATARVAGFRQLSDTTPSMLREAVSGFALHELEAYWSSLPGRFDGLAIFLTDETWLNEPLEVRGRSHGASWLVFNTEADRIRWLSAQPVTQPTPVRDPRGPRTAGPGVRFTVFRRDNFTCQYCGRRAPHVPLHVDHVIPRSQGGRTEIANLRTACSLCNLGKSDTPLDPKPA